MHTKFARRVAGKKIKIAKTVNRGATGQWAEKSALYFFIYMLDKIMSIYYNVITMTEGEYKDDK